MEWTDFREKQIQQLFKEQETWIYEEGLLQSKIDVLNNSLISISKDKILLKKYNQNLIDVNENLKKVNNSYLNMLNDLWAEIKIIKEKYESLESKSKKTKIKLTTKTAPIGNGN